MRHLAACLWVLVTAGLAAGADGQPPEEPNARAADPKFSSDALRIHIFNLEDFTERDFTFDLTFVNNLTWLDAHSLLLTAVGGN